MNKLILLLFLFSLLASCDQGRFEKGDPSIEIGVPDTVAIYWPPLEYDSILSSIHGRYHFSGDDTLDYLPRDRDLNLSVEYSGQLKEYMQYGRLVLEPYDSSCQVEQINDTLFRLSPRKIDADNILAIQYYLTFDDPYYFTYKFDGSNRTIAPKEKALMFMRSRYLNPF